MKRQEVYTLWAVNFLCFFLGELIVWLATHNWIAVLGAFVASLHFAVPVEYFKQADKKKT